MIFNIVFETTDCAGKDISLCREAIRAVIYSQGKLLLVRTKKGDYKFPGGGVIQEESHAETLVREVREETGYQIEKVNDLLGVVIERRPDKYDSVKIFEMKSFYYLCDIGSKQEEQDLDDYENELEFKPVWVEPDNAYLQNAGLIAAKADDLNPWVDRETLVLQQLLLKYFGK